MAHVAIIITGLRGKLNASLEIANRLRREGHSVTYVCPQDIGDEIEARNYRFVKVPEVNFKCTDPSLEKLHNSFIRRLVHHFKHVGSHYENGKKLLNLEEYKIRLNNLSPDRVLVDIEMHDFIFPTIALKIPITLFTTWFSDKISYELPPIRTAIIPGKGLKGSKLGIGAAWVYLRARFWVKLIIDYITLRHYRRYVLKRYAKEIGFDTSTLIANNFPPLFSHTKLPIVTMAMKELEFPHKFPKNLTYAGPMVFVDRENEVKDQEGFDEIKKIISEKVKSKRKLIYCSIGTYASADVSFLKNVIRAVEHERHWILIISLGGGGNVSDFGQLPKNVHVFSYVPQLEVLKNSECSINHGGINSINECINFKVPMLVYSGKKYDQNGCAARVAFHELGIMGDKGTDTVDSINSNIKLILKDSAYKENVLKFNAFYQTYRNQKISPFIFS